LASRGAYAREIKPVGALGASWSWSRLGFILDSCSPPIELAIEDIPAGAELCSAGLTLPGFATRVVTDANGEVLVGGAQDGESCIARIRP
jgi:hypothetical protein